jgi:hypothetical protein
VFSLGRSLLQGPGEPLDPNEGMLWVMRAALRGQPSAQDVLRSRGCSGQLPLPADSTGMMKLQPHTQDAAKVKVCGELIS